MLGPGKADSLMSAACAEDVAISARKCGLAARPAACSVALLEMMPLHKGAVSYNNFFGCGRSSVVERHVANVNVDGSNPFARCEEGSWSRVDFEPFLLIGGEFATDPARPCVARRGSGSWAFVAPFVLVFALWGAGRSARGAGVVDGWSGGHVARWSGFVAVGEEFDDVFDGYFRMAGAGQVAPDLELAAYVGGGYQGGLGEEDVLGLSRADG